MINFWGIKFKKYSKDKIFEIIDKSLGKNKNQKPLIVVTLNPEMLLFAEKDKAYKNILNISDLKIIDGFGLKLVGLIKKKNLPERIAGADLALKILKDSVRKKLKIAFVFRKNGLSDLEDLQNFSKKFRADIKFFEIDLKENGNDFDFNDREVFFVGLGVPHQEKFIYENKKNWPNLKLAIGIGGTFDFWTKKQKRAPKFMRKIGLEWFWRLLMNPKRFCRIWKSTFLFSIKSLTK